ncbi:MAG: 50S ribosomal protein L30, partial [Chloroflexi bacterium]|nr:50S ribosomal protein L30 [Chloroflexota bacterium]
MGSKLKITLLKSPIGRPESHKRTLKALGLRRLNQSVVKEDNP